MFRKKQYYEKEMECLACHKKSKPILEKNTINPGIAGFGRFVRVGSGLTGDKKYQLICPYCKAIIGFK